VKRALRNAFFGIACLIGLASRGMATRLSAGDLRGLRLGAMALSLKTRLIPTADSIPPTVWFTVTGDPSPFSARSVTINWCDNGSLAANTRQISLDGKAVTPSTYVTSAGGGCFRYATSVVTVQLSTLGTHTLSASISDLSGNTGSGDATLTYTAVAPVSSSITRSNISTVPQNGDIRTVDSCVLSCGEMAIAHATPAYMSRDASRNVTLAYRSGSAHPMPVVRLDVRDTTGTIIKWGLRLKASSGAYRTLTTGDTEIVRTARSGWNRLAAQYDASGDASGAYTFVAVITGYKASGAPTQDSATVRVLVHNQSTSKYGAGWGIAGLQTVSWAPSPSTGLTLADGSGNIGYWKNAGVSGNEYVYAPPAGDFTAVSYDAGTGVVKRKYLDGTTASFSGTTGRQLSIVDRFGNTTTFAYNADYSLKSITDPAGNFTILYYDSYDFASDANHAQHSLRRIDDPGGRSSYVDVTPDGNLYDAIDPDGQTAFLATYDGSHRLRARAGRAGQNWFTFTYDSTGALATTVTPPVIADGVTQQLTTRLSSLQSAELASGGSGQGTMMNPAPALDPTALRATVTDARGTVTRYAIDRWGAATAVYEPRGRVSSVQRDSLGRVTLTVAPSGAKTTMVWDGPDVVAATDSATGVTIHTHYANVHQPDHVWGGPTETWNTWVNGQLETTRSGTTSDPVTRFTYDANGRVKSVVDPGGHTASYTYESAGMQNVSIATTPGGRTTRYVYDNLGRARTVTTPDSIVHRTTLDPLNRVLSDSALAGTTTLSITRYFYGQAALDSLVDPLGQRYAFSYNALGWTTSRTDPRGKATTFAYDRGGLVTSTTNRRGQTIAFTYDSLGTIATRTADGMVARFATGAAGQYVADSNSIAIDTVFFDLAGRDTGAVQIFNGHRFVVGSSFDRFGRRTVSRRSGWGRGSSPVRYAYDARGTLDSLTDMTGRVTVIGHDAEGALTGVTWPSGLVSNTPGGQVHRAESQVYTGGSSTMASYNRSFAYDQLGRLQDEYNGETANRYRYDSLGHVTGRLRYVPQPNGCRWVSDGAGGQERKCFTADNQPFNDSTIYAYDRLGNPTTDGAVVETGNRLTHFGSTLLTYDDDGNLLTKSQSTSCACGTSYFWSALGTLDSIVVQSKGTLHLGYDSNGRRMWRRYDPAGASGVIGIAVYFVHDGDDMIGVVDESGGTLKEFAFWPSADSPHSVTSAAGTQYWHQDVFGNAIAQTDSLGNVAGSQSYDVYGEEAAFGNTTHEFGFKGAETEPDVGLVYMRARYYDPQLRRFIAEDPSGLSGGMNLYAFAGSDPVNGSDPSGLKVTGNCAYEIGINRCENEGGHFGGGGYGAGGGAGFGSSGGAEVYVCYVGGNATVAQGCVTSAEAFLYDRVSLSDAFATMGCSNFPTALCVTMVSTISEMQHSSNAVCSSYGVAAGSQLSAGKIVYGGPSSVYAALSHFWLSPWLRGFRYMEVFDGAFRDGLYDTLMHEEAHIVSRIPDDYRDTNTNANPAVQAQRRCAGYR
jgi:RHS repeat-associated protein